MTFHSVLRRLLIAVAAALCVFQARAAEGGIAILDVSAANGESETSGDWSRQLYSAEYLCQIAGYPYFVTADVDSAARADMIIVSSRLKSQTLTAAGWERLESFVSEGGTLVATVITATSARTLEAARRLFGIAGAPVVNKTRTRLLWSAAHYTDPELAYIDSPEEREMTIGAIHTAGYTPAEGAETLATFDDGTAAVVRHSLGLGRAYLAGVYLRDLIARCQLSKLPVSTRDTAEKFLPTADVLPLFIRAAYAAAHDLSVWKFTIPDGYESVLLPTHDCDSRTAYEAMHYMSRMERQAGVSAHYLLTCHYYRDADFFPHSYLSAFYNSETIPLARQLLADGHTAGSHSICHFPDFDKYSGPLANMDSLSRGQYQRRATCDERTLVSTGASTWAEIVLSKRIIEGDLGNRVRTFRPGHLLVNSDFTAALERGGYDFVSCYTASSLHSEFPTRMRLGNEWEGRCGRFLQIGINISDVIKYEDEGGAITDDDWQDHPIVSLWLKDVAALAANYAPATLLIHPNREWKATIERRLLDSLDLTRCAPYNFERFGDFWLARLAADFAADYDEATATLAITTTAPAASGLCYAVETRRSVSSATVLTPDGPCPADIKAIAGGRLLIVPRAPGSSAISRGPQADASPARWYDLAGRPVAAPRGLCVRRQGGRAVKLTVK